MSISLTPFQDSVTLTIARTALEVADATDRRKTADLLRVAAAYAHALHLDLEQGGQHIQHSPTMLGNRQCSPDDPDFYRHLDAIQDFVAIVSPASKAIEPPQ
jgi:hypothetical protein